MSEIWKPVVGCDMYSVSNLGNIKRVKPAKGAVVGLILSKQVGKEGYERVMVRQFKTKLVHRIVAESFIGNADGKDINHINGNKSDNRLENLEICSRSYNMKHAISKLGTRISNMNAEKVHEIRRMYSYGLASKELAKAFGVTNVTIWNIATGKTWGCV